VYYYIKCVFLKDGCATLNRKMCNIKLSTITGNNCNNRVCKCKTTRTHLNTVVINLINFFGLPGIRTQTDHLQGDLGVLVLVVYLKPEAEYTSNLTNKTT